jgi:phage tail sheath protein FI
MGLFTNTETVDISLLMTADANSTVQAYAIGSVGEVRKDIVVFCSPPLANVTDTSGAAASIANYVSPLQHSSYTVFDSGFKYQYDKYNDMYRWIPLNGDIAGLCAATDDQRDPWWSPAGLQRGRIKNSLRLAFNPTKTDRDTLYKAGVNPVVAFPAEGTILFGDKTFLNYSSAFDRINVRRLFIVLEKAIAKAARTSLFEFNDTFTRAQFVSLVEPFLRTVKGRRGITDYKVVCDTTNNTGFIIDSNQFVGDIYIKPARSINFIQLNFVAVRTGVSFTEVVGKF